MGLRLPGEIQMLKETVRRFVDQELIPIEVRPVHVVEGGPLMENTMTDRSSLR